MTIHEKLAQIQSKLFVPKGQNNDFGGYKYRSCEDILKAVKPLCEEVKTVLYMTNELIEVGGRNYVKASVVLQDLESEEFILSSAQAREEETKKGMDGSQITGSSSSYARKYALAGLFCIDNEKDSDATNEKTKNMETASDKQIKLLKGYCSASGFTLEKLCESNNVADIDHITPKIASDWIEGFKKKGVEPKW